jgi:alkyl hydroperoxide reductase subunit AhpC
MAKPRERAPGLEVATVGGGRWSLADASPGSFTLIVFYRGLHCPVCRTYLGGLNERAGEFAKRGVEVITVSGDDAARAGEARREWGLDELVVGYGQSVGSMREWGLYVSRAIRDGETAEFSEPGLFLVRPDGTLYMAIINSMPFARPGLDDVLRAVDFVIERDYPARGEA